MCLVFIFVLIVEVFIIEYVIYVCGGVVKLKLIILIRK